MYGGSGVSRFERPSGMAVGAVVTVGWAEAGVEAVAVGFAGSVTTTGSEFVSGFGGGVRVDWRHAVYTILNILIFALALPHIKLTGI